MNEIIRFLFMSMWLAINATVIYTGFVLLKNPFAASADPWPFGGGVLFCGLASTLFWMFHLIAIFK